MESAYRDCDSFGQRNRPRVGANCTCKDNFYCFLTKDDAGGLVRIELTLSNMKVVPPNACRPAILA
jgi:hypothetical protein